MTGREGDEGRERRWTKKNLFFIPGHYSDDHYASSIAAIIVGIIIPITIIILQFISK